MDRRTLLAAGAAALLPPVPSARRLDKIGVQLYTVRNEMKRDVDATLARVAEIGFQEVEFAGYFNKNPDDLRRTLARLGLTAPGAHYSFEEMRDGWDRTLDAASRVGHRWAIVAWIPGEERTTLDGWRRVAEWFNHAGEQTRAAGLRFAYHNHSYEFTPVEGRIPFDVLLAETDPAVVEIEMDLYWITKGGQDPRVYFARHPGRFPLVHVKDAGPAPDFQMVDVGRGAIDWKGIFAMSRQAGMRHVFVEHDEPDDAFASIATGLQYLKRLRF